MPTTSLLLDEAASAPHAARPLTADELDALWHRLQQPTALIEVAALLGCIGLAWLVVRLWRGPAVDERSVWFGRHVIDGALFPLLALVLAVGARALLAPHVPPAVFRVVVPMLVSLAAIRLTVKVLNAVFPNSSAVQAIERTVSWGAWIATALWITGVLPLIMDELDAISWKVGGSTLSLRKLIEGSLSAVVVLILSLSLSSAIESRLLRGATDNLSLRKIVANLVRALLIGLGLLMALSAAGVDLTALSVLGGAVGVGLGFGLQKLAANYVSGFVILAERSLRIGDLVKVDNFEGRVTDINTRYTVVRSGSGREAIIPNEMLITQRVENASLADNSLMLTTVVQVAYGTNVEQVMAQLAEAVGQVPRVAPSPPVAVHLTAFAADGLELTVAYWVADPENGQLSARSAVNLAILRCLDAMGVEIPFPQRVLHRATAVRAEPLEVSSTAP